MTPPGHPPARPASSRLPFVPRTLPALVVAVALLVACSADPISQVTTRPDETASPSPSLASADPSPSLPASPAQLPSPQLSLVPTTPPTPTPRPATPTPTPPTDPAFASLSAPQTVDCSSGFATVTLSWNAVRATQVTVSIDGEGIFDTYGPTGSEEFPFGCAEEQHTYLFRALGADGKVTSVTKVIKRA